MHASRALPLLLVAAACAPGDQEPTDVGEAVVHIHTPSTQIPSDGECTHITATRLSDFQVTTYVGPLAGGTFRAPKGEHRIAARAYAQPCEAEPPVTPWGADDQIATFANGANELQLNFRRSGGVDIDIVPEFFDDEPAPLVVQVGSRVRAGRNGEDAAGPNFSLDAWELKEIALPPAAPAETVRFSTQGSPVPYTPRGVARDLDGSFVFQVGETYQPVWHFDAAGNYLEAWPVEYPDGTIVWDFTDGLDVVDATRFVRTAWLNLPIGCDDEGAGCLQSAIEILEKKQRPDGSTYLEVVQQIHLPEGLSREFAVGVASLGDGRFAVSTLPATNESRLIIIDAARNLLNTPVVIDGSREGLFIAADGRLGALDYAGALSMHDANDLAALGQTTDYPVAADFSVPDQLIWDGAGDRFIAHNGLGRLAYVAPAFDAVLGDIALDLGGIVSLSGMAYLAASDELAVLDRLPPLIDGTRTPAVQLFNLTTLAAGGTIVFTGGPTLPLRPRTVAYNPTLAQLIVHHRRPGGVVDAALDATAYVHDATGAFVRSIDLAPLGVARINSVNYLETSDELAFTVTDIAGVGRLLITSSAGVARRSYPLAPIAGATDLVQLPSGELGVIFNQPSEFARVLMP